MSRASAADEIAPILSILHKWGVHTVGQFAALDKQDISLRLGPAAVRMWERANGKATRVLKLVQPPESFAETYEFEHEVETIDPLLFILRRFLQQIATRLNAIYLVTEELTLTLSFSNRGQYQRVFTIPQPTNDVDLLFRVIHTHLENFTSEHPIVAIALDARPAKPSPQQFGLFETALRNPLQLSETLARLTAILGNDRVGTPVVEETHRPDAFHLEPFQWTAEVPTKQLNPSAGASVTAKESNKNAPARVSPTRPPALRRFRAPVPAAVLLDGNTPAHIRSAGLSGSAADQTGPYLQSGNWWDENNWARREWDIELNSGAVLRCHEDRSGWQIDGLYD